MNLNDYKTLLISIAIFLIFISFIPVFSEYVNHKTNEYFSLSILGKNGVAENYFSFNDNQVGTDEKMDWIVNVDNKMGSLQYVKLIFKLINSSELNDNILCISNPKDKIYEISKLIESNENLEEKIQWYISEVERDEKYVVIKKMVFNDNEFETNLMSLEGQDFIFLVELWVYDPQKSEFIFGWNKNDQQECLSNKIWFNIQRTGGVG
jgi:hypothetical protein